MKIRVMVVFGTRPEAIKMAPILAALHRRKDQFTTQTVVTGQHKEMLAQCLTRFNIKPDKNLQVMTPGQTLSDLTCSVIQGLSKLFDRLRPDLVLVQGDTTTSFATSLCAFYHTVPVGHVEAGLRTGDKRDPYPEEINRRLTGALADFHFAPTRLAYDHLLAEGIPKSRIHQTGNTIVDALHGILAAPACDDEISLPPIPSGKKIWLLTLHRRESFGKPMEGVFKAMRTLVAQYPQVVLIYPVHPNPNVRDLAHRLLRGQKRIHLWDPIEYFSFVRLLSRADLVLTDSGGIQEEAPSLGKPVLVLRNKTERPEGIKAGVARLVGTDPNRIIKEVSGLMDHPWKLQKMAKGVNPYGDGRAAERIVRILASHFTGQERRPKKEVS